MSKKSSPKVQAEVVVVNPIPEVPAPAPTAPQASVTVPEAKVFRTNAEILDAVVARNLEGFVRPFQCVRTEVGVFTAVNNRPGTFAYVWADVSGKEFRCGKAQAKRLGLKVPTKAECSTLNAAWKATHK